MFLIKRTLLYNLLFILWSSSAISFVPEDRIEITSDDGACIPTNYEDVLTRIEKFESYKDIDDQISWSSIQSHWLSSLDILPRTVFDWFSMGRRPLDMTISLEIPQDPQEDELKRSKVWVAFSPLQLPKEWEEFYPKIPLLCTILEEEEGEVIHECNQTTGIAYAIQSFSSKLHISKDDCGIRSVFEIVFDLHRQEVDRIYQSIVNYYRLPDYFSSFMRQVNKNQLFSLYFENLYSQLLL